MLISSLLADIERRFLADPVAVNRLRLEITPARGASLATLSFNWPQTLECDRFVEARQHLFQAILRGDEQLILQGSDLIALREPAENYASAYVDWLEAAMVRAASADAVTSRDAFEELRGALTVDSVALVIDDYRGRRREAVLLGPTHPLRITWHTTTHHLAHDLGTSSAAMAAKGPAG
ncbi:MAG: hypothetical protein AW12_03117 [Candidatus Accumulibacter sp. BA-94]|nr:MAG: hypothetical protein AW12_03117 [Candidatus Accumulibacter sp. BA-94]